MSTRGRNEDEAVKQAACWLVALEEAPDDAALRARFEAWLAASQANRDAWSGTSEVYDFIGTPEYVAHRAARQALSGRRLVRLLGRHPIGRRAGLALAGFAVAAGVALLLLPGIVLRLQADLVTAVAETRSLELQDGTTIDLGPDSAVAVLPGPSRAVRLLKGQAFFHVARDPQRPFRVAANAVETTVLGTAFDVRLQQDGAVVTVREGLVRVDYAGTPRFSELLAAGDWASIAAPDIVDRGVVPPAEVAVWQAGRIVARDRAIADVIDEIQRSFPGAIVMPNEAFGRRRITGVYNLSDPEAALRAVVGVYGGTVHRFSPWLLVVFAG